MRRLRNIGRLFTGTAAGVIEDAAVICDGEQIAWCGKHGDEPRELMESVTDEDDCANGLVTAGLIDAHTHPVYAGDRMREVEQIAKDRWRARAIPLQELNATEFFRIPVNRIVELGGGLSAHPLRRRIRSQQLRMLHLKRL